MYVPVPVLAHMGFLSFSCPCCSWLLLVDCRMLDMCSLVEEAIISSCSSTKAVFKPVGAFCLNLCLSLLEHFVFLLSVHLGLSVRCGV